jgi:hypothetical protein
VRIPQDFNEGMQFNLNYECYSLRFAITWAELPVSPWRGRMVRAKMTSLVPALGVLQVAWMRKSWANCIRVDNGAQSQPPWDTITRFIWASHVPGHRWHCRSRG